MEMQRKAAFALAEFAASNPVIKTSSTIRWTTISALKSLVGFGNKLYKSPI